MTLLYVRAAWKFWDQPGAVDVAVAALMIANLCLTTFSWTRSDRATKVLVIHIRPTGQWNSLLPRSLREARGFLPATGKSQANGSNVKLDATSRRCCTVVCDRSPLARYSGKL